MSLERRSPGLAAILSLVPGLGHCYAGKVEKGVGLFAATGLLGILMVIVPGVQYALFSGRAMSLYPGLLMIAAPLFLFVVAPALMIYSMADAYRIVSRAREGGGGMVDGRSGRRSAGPPSVTVPRGLALGLVAVGLLQVLHALFPRIAPLSVRFWPVLLVAIGALLLWRAMGSRWGGTSDA